MFYRINFVLLNWNFKAFPIWHLPTTSAQLSNHLLFKAFLGPFSAIHPTHLSSSLYPVYLSLSPANWRPSPLVGPAESPRPIFLIFKNYICLKRRQRKAVVLVQELRYLPCVQLTTVLSPLSHYIPDTARIDPKAQSIDKPLSTTKCSPNLPHILLPAPTKEELKCRA